LEAASISRKSRFRPDFISLQFVHPSQGFEVGFSEERQFKHLAKILARVVFTTPLVPEKKY
jgi:hypothetical protein